MGYCTLCGKKLPPKGVLVGKNGAYCSRTCRYSVISIKSLRIAIGVYVGLGIAAILMGLIGYLVDTVDPIMWLIVGGASGTGLVIGFPVLYLEYRRVKKAKAEIVYLKYYCPFCESEVEKPEDDGPIVCMSCGEKTPMCHICGRRIMQKEEVYTLVPCGHTVHKDEVWSWLEKKKSCPLCDELISSVDIDLEKD